MLIPATFVDLASQHVRLHANLLSVCSTVQVAGRTLLPAASVLQMASAATAMLAPSAGKGAAPLLTAVSLPSALQLGHSGSGSDLGPAAAPIVQLLLNQLHGETRTMSQDACASLTQRSDGSSLTQHLTATIGRVRRASSQHAAGISKHGQRRLRLSLILLSARTDSTAHRAASWAAVKILTKDDDFGGPLDGGLHLGIVIRRQTDGQACAPQVPVGAAAYASSAQPAYACAIAAGGISQPSVASALSEHRLQSETGHAGSVVLSLQSKSLSLARPAPPVAAHVDAANTADPDCLYQVVHCVSTPATARSRVKSQRTEVSFRPIQPTDVLLRGIAASLATAQEAHGTVTHIGVRTAGAVRDSGDAPHAVQQAAAAAVGSAMWSLTRTQQAEASGVPQCSGADEAAADVAFSASVALLLDPSREGRADAAKAGGVNERLSQHAGKGNDTSIDEHVNTSCSYAHEV